MNTIVFDSIFYGLQVVVFQLFASPILSQFSYNRALAKNSDWTKSNPSFTENYKKPKVFHNYVMGFIMLLFIGYGAWTEDNKILYFVHLSSICLFLIQSLLIDGIRDKKISKLIPLPELRKASVLSRQLTDYLPKWFISVSVFIIVFAWFWFVTLVLIGEIPNDKILKNLIFWMITNVVMFTSMNYCLKSKPVVRDSEKAAFYRKSEIYAITLIHLFFVIRFLITLSGYTFESSIFNATKDITEYMFTLLSIMIFVWFIKNRNMQELSQL